MKKYIDAEGVMRACYDSFLKTGNKAYSDIIALAEAVPAADVQEVRHGRWKEEFDGIDTIYECSVCGEPFVTLDGTPADNLWNYCPNCGSRMDLGDEVEE